MLWECEVAFCIIVLQSGLENSNKEILHKDDEKLYSKK